MDVVCFGELLLDMFPSEVDLSLGQVRSFEPKPGGAPANVAVSLARLGVRSAFIGKVGNDAFGHHLAQVLEREGVEIRGLRYDEEARTTLAFIAKPDPDTAEFLFYRNPGADTRLRISELDKDLLNWTRILHLGSLSLVEDPIRSAALAAVGAVKGAGGRISMDVNYRPTLWGRPEDARDAVLDLVTEIDLLKVNEDELDLLTGHRDLDRGTLRLVQEGPEIIVVTLGPAGSYYRTTAGSGFVPPFKVETVDATGCGDAFIAGVLAQLIDLDHKSAAWNNADWSEIVRYANAVGAITAKTMGVIPALPTAMAVERFLSDRK